MIDSRQYPAIPGPRLPLVVQTVLYGLKTAEYLEWCHRRYGDVFSVRLPGSTFVVLADPAAIRTVFELDASDYAVAANAAFLSPFVGDQSVLLRDGDAHRAARRRLVAAFHAETTKAWSQAMTDITVRHIADWPVGTPFALLPRFQAITLDMIKHLVLGATDSDDADQLNAAFQPWLAQAGSVAVLAPPFRRRLLGLSPWARFVRQRARVDAALDRLIAARRADPCLAERTDVLSALLRADGLDDAELRDTLLTMLAAGHDTTASSSAWAFDLLLRDPDRYRRLGDDDYLDAVAKEVLRLRPVVEMVGRPLTRPITIGDYELPAGVTAAPSVLLAHRRPQSYDQPLTFRPERFLGQRPDPASWLPFGGGVRRCLGANFAMLELRTVLRTVWERTDLRPVGRPEHARRRAVTLIPKKGSTAVLVKRPRMPG